MADRYEHHFHCVFNLGYHIIFCPKYRRKLLQWGIINTYEYQALKEGDEWPEFKNYALLAFLEQAIICEVVGNIHDNPDLMEQRK